MKIYKLHARYLTILAITIIGLVSCDNVQDKNINNSQIQSYLKEKFFEIPKNHEKISDFQYSLLTGEKESLSNNQGKLILLNFWATWCFPCKQEMPDLEELKILMKDEPFRILALNSGEKQAKVQRFIKKNPYTFDIVLDESREISKDFKIVGLPTTLIIDRELNVLGKIMGPVDWKDPSFVDFLKKVSRT